MPLRPYSGLADRLIAQGIAPKHARRMADELSDHLADLAESDLLSPAQAAERLGDESRIERAARVLLPRAQRVPRPWLSLTLGPIFGTAIAIVVLGELAIFVGKAWGPTSSAHATWAMLAHAGISNLPIPIGAFGCWIAMRFRAPLSASWVGCLALALFAGSLDLGYQLPSATESGLVTVEWGAKWSFWRTTLPLVAWVGAWCTMNRLRH